MFVSSSLAACSSGSNSGGEGVLSEFGGDGASQNGVVNDQGSTSAIAGLWDFTQSYGAEGTDVFYILFRSNGTGAVYDWMGDSYDMGENCYTNSEFTFESLGGDRYATPTFAFNASQQNGNLSFSDPDGRGVFPSAVGLSAVDFNSCI